MKKNEPSAVKQIVDAAQRAEAFGRTEMPDTHVSIAVSLAKMLINTRERFVDALHASARARIEANRRTIYSFQAEIPRRAVEPHADEALDAIYRDGLSGLEDNIRCAVDEIVREGLDAARKAPCEWRSL